MKALSYRNFGTADVLEWTAGRPVPNLRADEVLIRVAAAGINLKDVLLRKGKFSRTLAREPLPRISGLEIAGEIVKICNTDSRIRRNRPGHGRQTKGVK